MNIKKTTTIVSVAATDNEPGLPERVRNELFQPFARSSRAGGSGLSLSIARDLMPGHGGDISLARSTNGGTVFRFSLPIEPNIGLAANPDLGARLDIIAGKFGVRWVSCG